MVWFSDGLIRDLLRIRTTVLEYFSELSTVEHRLYIFQGTVPKKCVTEKKRTTENLL